MSENNETPALGHADERLVEMVTAALVDPNVHTDTRMRLREEITEILRRTHKDVYGPDVPHPYEEPLSSGETEVPEVLASVLVDPNLHTDVRMRLHAEIPELLETARHHAQVGAH